MPYKRRPKNKQELSPKSGARAKKKVTKPRQNKRVPIEKPFNAGTMSTAAFFSFIRSALRRKSMFWKPILNCKKNARREYEGENKRQKFEYQCGKCMNYFPDKEVAVHHIRPVGALNGFEDLPEFVKNLFCEEEGLILLCDGCHDKEHKKR